MAIVTVVAVAVVAEEEAKAVEEAAVAEEEVKRVVEEEDAAEAEAANLFPLMTLGATATMITPISSAATPTITRLDFRSRILQATRTRTTLCSIKTIIFTT